MSSLDSIQQAVLLQLYRVKSQLWHVYDTDGFEWESMSNAFGL